MKKFNLVVFIIVISVVGVIFTSASFVVPDLKATSDIDNSTPQPSNQGTVQLQLTPQETIVQSNNLQNPSIQDSINQQQQQQQQPLNLSSGVQQDNKGNTGSQGTQNNLPPNTGDPFSLCNPYGGTCKAG